VSSPFLNTERCSRTFTHSPTPRQTRRSDIIHSAQEWSLCSTSAGHTRAFLTGINVITNVGLPEPCASSYFSFFNSSSRRRSCHDIEAFGRDCRTGSHCHRDIRRHVEGYSTTKLGATAISGALLRSGLRPGEIGTVVMGMRYKPVTKWISRGGRRSTPNCRSRSLP
jgi:hypothetical protein